MSNQLPRVRVQRKSGDEYFHFAGRRTGFGLLEFWRWSVSDLVSNAARGRLAEYIVARALDIPTDGVRDEWGACDLISPGGLKVEVKSAAYVQAWYQKSGYSTIQFSTRASRPWDPDTNTLAKEACRTAHVYVFALLAHTGKATIDPLDLCQWEFYVLPTKVLDARHRSQHSITLPSLRKLCEPLKYADLRPAVERLAAERGLPRV